jgi:methyltransferase
MMDVMTRLDPLSGMVLSFVTAQRLAELVYARRNEQRLLERGGVEHGAEHFIAIVCLHTAWLLGLWVLASGIRPHTMWLLVFVALQTLRVWVLATLGPRWTTRIIVLRDEPLVRTGPYRWLSHPNYIVVALEIFVLPMAYGLLLFALLFSVLNAAILFVRIRSEDAALREAGAATK